MMLREFRSADFELRCKSSTFFQKLACGSLRVEMVCVTDVSVDEVGSAEGLAIEVVL